MLANNSNFQKELEELEIIRIKIGFHGVLKHEVQIYESKTTKIIHKFCSTQF